MKNLSKEITSDLAEYRDVLKRAAYKSGKNYSSIWFKKANIEQIDELLSKKFSRYAKNNDITFLYSGVKEELKNAANSDWKEILETKSVNPKAPCHYVLLDLMLEYHDGLKDGVRQRFGKIANKFCDCDYNDNENDDNTDDDDC